MWRKQFLLLSTALLLFQSLTIVRLAPISRWSRDADDDDKESSKILKTEDLPKKDEIETILFEGDIILTGAQKEANMRTSALHVQKRSAVVYSNNGNGKSILSIWPNATVPFVFASRLGARERMYFSEAMSIIENGTCIRYMHKHASHKDYMELDYDTGCKSNVGRAGGVQRVTLSNFCSSVGNAIHELGHTLGLWHEHSRPDRDSYIDVQLANLEDPNDEVHFRKTSQALFKSVPDVGYDIQSMMHYSKFAYAGSRNGIDLATIRIREDSSLDELNCLNRLPMGQRTQLSHKDKLRIKELYGCNDVVEEPQCIRPTPTPTVASTDKETEIPETQLPVPSSVMPTPSPLRKRLKSGNILTLNMMVVSQIDGTKVENIRGMECVPSPGCVPVSCDYGSACTQGYNQFQIIKRDERDSKATIRGGNTVLLRSIEDYSRYLDCSDRSICKTSPCTEDNANDPNNASYVSSCAKHRFEILGIGRNNSVLNTNHSLQFRSIEQNGLLKCSKKKCGLDVSCRKSASCTTNIFRAIKIAEY